MPETRRGSTRRARSVVYRGLAVLTALLATQCGGTSSPSAPGAGGPTSSVSDFISGVSASGASVSQQPGSPPAASGGPSATLGGSSNVSSGGSNVVQIIASVPFQIVNFAIGASGSSSASTPFAATPGGIDGFWQLKLSAPATSVDITYTVNTTVPVADNGQISLLFQLVSPSGAVGPAATQGVTKVKGTTYTGPFAGVRTFVRNPIVPCIWTTTFSGNMRMILEQRPDGTAVGIAEMNGTEGTIVSGVPSRCSTGRELPFLATFPVTGTPAHLAGGTQNTSSSPDVTVTNTLSFSGALTSGTISGTMTYAISIVEVAAPAAGSTTFTVTLR